MSLGEVIRQRRQEKQLTQDQVAPRVGISKPYLSNIENDKVKNPPSDKVVKRLERALGFTTGELMRMAHTIRTPTDVRTEQETLAGEVEKLRGVIRQLTGKGKPPKGTEALARRLAATDANISQMISAGRAIPVINRVAAGYPHDFTDLDYPTSIADEYVRCPDVHDPQAFAARVVGDSMEPRYHEGDVVVFEPNTPARVGDDCFVRFADDNSTTFKRLAASRGALRLSPLNDKYESKEYDPEAVSGLWPATRRIERIR